MSQQTESPQQNRQVRIEITDDVADGIYANIAFIATNNSEFVLDFGRFLPGNSRGKVVTRVVMNPMNAKGFLKSLSDSVERFEKQFGTISPESTTKNIGFTIDSDKEEKKKKSE
ncbi:DUF3467 domain-containing protein [bacterium]|nr:DUF3467 domain-containing protein [bacterium]